MVQALITLTENTSRIINIIKAQFGLKDKSEAINLVIKRYEEELMEPEFKPEFIRRVLAAEKGKFHEYKSVEEFEKAIGL